MKQSKSASLIEAISNIAVGFGLSILFQATVLPLLGVQIPWSANFAFALVMTAVSIARQFVLRRVFEALHIRRPLSPFMQAVIEERFRHVFGEGYHFSHDDQLKVGELSRAGASYALCADHWINASDDSADGKPAEPLTWPWVSECWKPYGFRRDLVRAGALVIAEGEKFDRNRRPARPPNPAVEKQLARVMDGVAKQKTPAR